jgi:outer membrane protein OmpA-like peptidoglycan-associated protein
MQRNLCSATLALLLTASSAPAGADGWLVAEAPAAVAVSDVQQGVFRAGAMPAFGAYAASSRVALGLRMRAGVLRNGPAPNDQTLRDPGTGGLATLGVAVRFPVRAAWLEAVAGGGITGRDIVPTVEAGAGWTFQTKRFDIGPSVRYVRVISRDEMAAFGTAELVLVGVDVLFGKDRPARVMPPPPVSPGPVVVEVAADHDDVIDRESSCAQLLDAGCPIAEAIQIIDDRIVLDERVLFDFDRARVRSSGKRVIAAIAKLWQEHPEWQRLTIEGHADVRGTDEYNQSLSESRAQHVRQALVEAGATPDLVGAIGYGRSKPRDPGTTETAHQRNRRVEFVIDRHVPAGDGEQQP